MFIQPPAFFREHYRHVISCLCAWLRHTEFFHPKVDKLHNFTFSLPSKALWYRSSRLSWEGFLLLHRFVTLFVSLTLLSWSCNETSGSRIQGTATASPILCNAFHYCRLLILGFGALSEIWLTAEFGQLRQSNPAFETVSSIVFHPPQVPHFHAVPAQRLRLRACTEYARQTFGTDYLGHR